MTKKKSPAPTGAGNRRALGKIARGTGREVVADRKSQVLTAGQASLRELAKSWPAGDYVQRMAAEIDADIPPGNQHESAVRAREFAAGARKWGMSEKGVVCLFEALAAWKDLMLFDDAILGEARRKQQRRNASTPRKLDADDRRRIVLRYQSMCDQDEKYGAIKLLASMNNVSRGTIERIIKKGV